MAKKARQTSKRKVTMKQTRRAVKRTTQKKAIKTRKTARKPIRKAVAKRTFPVAAKLGATPLKGQANLIVTFDPNHRGSAELELREVLRQAGEKPQIGQTEVEGLFKVAVSDGRKAALKIRSLCQKNPELFSVTHRYIPIDKWCKSEIAEMQKLIKAISSGIGTNEKWKMGLNKRHWDKLEGGQLIVKLTDVVERRQVDLDNPDKIVQVEIIGKEAGVSLLSRNDLIDIAREKEEKS